MAKTVQIYRVRKFQGKEKLKHEKNTILTENTNNMNT